MVILLRNNDTPGIRSAGQDKENLRQIGARRMVRPRQEGPLATGLGKRLLGRAIGVLAMAASASAAIAEEPVDPIRPTHNMFGMTGLVDTPTADM